MTTFVVEVRDGFAVPGEPDIAAGVRTVEVGRITLTRTQRHHIVGAAAGAVVCIELDHGSHGRVVARTNLLLIGRHRDIAVALVDPLGEVVAAGVPGVQVPGSRAARDGRAAQVVVVIVWVDGAVRIVAVVVAGIVAVAVVVDELTGQIDVCVVVVAVLVVAVEVAVAVDVTVGLGNGGRSLVSGTNRLELGAAVAVAVAVGVEHLGIGGVFAVDSAIAVIVDTVADLFCIRVDGRVVVVAVLVGVEAVAVVVGGLLRLVLTGALVGVIAVPASVVDLADHVDVVALSVGVIDDASGLAGLHSGHVQENLLIGGEAVILLADLLLDVVEAASVESDDRKGQKGGQGREARHGVSRVAQ